MMHYYTEAKKSWSSPKPSEFWYHHRSPRAVPSFHQPSKTSSDDVIDFPNATDLQYSHRIPVAVNKVTMF